MGFLSSLIGNSAAKPVDAIGNAFDKIFTSDEERLKASAVLEKLRQHPGELQVELNKIEAGSRTFFIAGWRPFSGWACGITLAIYGITCAIVTSWMWVTMCLSQNMLIPYPEIPGITTILVAMLGIGGYRTLEKFGGKTK